MVFVVLLVIGMMLVIVIGGIDFFVGVVMVIVGVIMVVMMVVGFSLSIVLLSVLGIGILVGLWNGILVAIFKI